MKHIVHVGLALILAPLIGSADTIVLEAEDFNSQVLHGSDHQWALSNSIAGFGGAGYMDATPDNGSGFDPTWISSSPELQYSVNFTTSATYSVWIRGDSPNVNGDSLHAGLDGTTNTAARITFFTPNNAWVWTNRTSAGNAATISVGSTGAHTFSLWMREDGMRVDRIALTTEPGFQPTVGNVFHIPNTMEADLVSAGIPTMRNPLSAIFSNTPVALYTGNQFQGSGNPGNQLQSGSAIFYKKSTDSMWNSLPLFFFKEGTSNPNNKYYSNSIPANVFSAGDTVQYYFKIPYSDHLPTFVYGNDAQRFNTEIESVAQANPFSFKVLAPPTVSTLSPTDWRDINIYQVITDRFHDGDPSNNLANPDGVFDPAGQNALHGGDFKGLQQKLDYIKGLGANAIWISPIVHNTFGQYHGYHGWDFYSVDPHWGTYEEMTNVIAAAHARGIYVILDVVTNHGGDLIDSTEAGYLTTFRTPPSGYTMRFKTNKLYPPPFDTNAVNPVITSLFHTNGLIQNFDSTTQVELGELRGLDDLQTELTYVRTNMVNIWQHWIGRGDFDGFRVDTTKHIENSFWQFWCPQIHQYGTGIGKSNFFFFGETLTGSDGAVGFYTGTKAGGNFEYDSMLDYALYFSINPVFANPTGNTKQIEDHYNAIPANYDPAAANHLVTFLDNHDQPRFLSSNNANNNTNRLGVALAFLYTSRGVPCLYYGTEQAFNGVKELNREDMFDGGFPASGPALGDNFNETHPLFQLVAKLNNFRRLYPSLRRGVHVNRWYDDNSPGLFAYARQLGGEETFIVFNTAAGSQTLPNRPTSYTAGTVLVNLLNTNETLTVTGTPEIPSVSVPATSAKIFIAQSLMKPLDPVVVTQSPAHGATNVSPAAQIVLKFSKPMNTNAVQSAFSLTPPTAGTFAWSAVRDTMTFTASGGFPVLTTNTLFVATNAVDAVSTNALFSPFETYFVTAATAGTDSVPPSVFIDMPLEGSTLTGLSLVNGTAGDDLGVAKVEIRLDNGNWFPVTGTTNWSLSFDTANFLNGSHVVSARATDTSGNVSTLDARSVRFFNVPGNYVQRISPGSFNDVTDCLSNVWVKDQAYNFGSFGFMGGSPGFVGNTITNVCLESQLLYQRERFGSPTASFRYLFDCPEGIYETTLLESETRTNVVNGRVFNVFIQDQQVLTNLDIFAVTGGKDRPLVRVFTNTVTDSQLHIEFSSVIGSVNVGSARASGIQLRKIGDVDTDADGIPDWWMLAYFDHPTGQDGDGSLTGDDADGDGMDNLEEFLASTDPTDANSAFRITNIATVGIDVLVSWESAPAESYQLRRASSPDNGASWTDAGSPMPGTGGIVTQTDFGGATNTPPQFYRVRLLP